MGVEFRLIFLFFNPTFFLHISSSLVNVRLHTKIGFVTCLEVPVGGG
jgi:hypothetical protein